MANTGVKGRIVYADNNIGIQGLEIHAWNDDPFELRIHLGNAKTDATGNFSISYPESVYRSWIADLKPSIRIQVFISTSRLVYEYTLKENVTDTELVLPLVKIHRNHLGEPDDPNSWLVTNATLDPVKADAVFLTQNNEIEWLVDGAAMFPAVTRAAEAATSSVNFMNLNFWIAGSVESLDKNDLLVTEFIFPPGNSSTNPPLNVPINGKKFQEIIRAKAQNNNLDVRIVVGDIPVTSGDTVDVTKKYFAGSPVKLRILNTGASLLHAKVITVDDNTAFVVGSTFSQGYFSDQHHNIRDVTHRGSLMHDVSAKVSGPAVFHIKQSFATIYNAADQHAVPLLYDDPVTVTPPANPISLQVLCTLSANGFKTASKQSVVEEMPAGLTSILESYQRAIANATEYIYIEDQYFTNRDIARAILLRMKEMPSLEVILVVNIVPDMPGYTYMQMGIISQLVDELGINKDKLGCYTLWSWQQPATPQRPNFPYEIMPIYIHSKTAFIDDKWATTGSANTDGSAMNYIQVSNMLWGLLIENRWTVLLVLVDAFLAAFAIFTFFTLGLGWLLMAAAAVALPLLLLSAFKAAFSKTFAESFAGSIKSWDEGMQHALLTRDNHPYRHAELNVTAFNNVAGQPQTDKITELRETIWREHLGIAAGSPLIKETGSWIKLWDKQAESKLSAVKANVASDIKIMKWQFGETPRSHLKKLGIDNPELFLREKADRFNYLKGTWIP